MLLKAGDIVLADRNGRRFFAVVTERRERELDVEPIDRRVSYHLVKAREVIGTWRKSRAQNGRTAGSGSREVDGMIGGRERRANPEPDDLASRCSAAPTAKSYEARRSRARAYVADVFGEIT